MLWIILGIVLILTISQLVVLGALGGIGPLGFIKENKIKNAPGNAQQYHLENVEPLETSPLAGKQLLFLGSSVTRGEASLGVSMADYIGKLDGCTVYKEAVSGTTLAGMGSSTYTSRLLKVDTALELDCVICQLSTNDATRKKGHGPDVGFLFSGGFRPGDRNRCHGVHHRLQPGSLGLLCGFLHRYKI